IFLTLLTLVLIGVGYFFALTAKGEQVFIALVPVVLLVITGTYFLFTQLTVFFINLLMSSKKVFWKKTNMLLLSDLSHRMKDNARAFFMVTVISTVAFSAIGTLVGLNSFLTDGIRGSNLYTYQYPVMEDEDPSEAVQEIFDEYNLTVEEATIELEEYIINDHRIPIATDEQYNTL